MKLDKSQITIPKLQINLKFQYSNPKQISEYKEFYQFLLCRNRKDYNKIFSIVIILKLMERSDATIRHSSFDIIHSKGGFFAKIFRI